MRFLKAIVSRWNKINRPGKIIIALLAVAMAVFVIAYFEPHKLFIDQEINEDFPAPVAVGTTTTAASPGTETPRDRCSSYHHRACGCDHYNHRC